MSNFVLELLCGEGPVDSLAAGVEHAVRRDFALASEEEKKFCGAGAEALIGNFSDSSDFTAQIELQIR